MKLRNKKTGEIKEIEPITIGGFRSLAELNEAWEDYEEPSDIKSVGTIGSSVHIELKTEEEAEKAVEKLKAWKRLKDRGFETDLWDYDGGNYQKRIRTGRILFTVKEYEENDKDLDLLFGGEE